MSLASNKVSLIWNIANHLRGWWKAYEYQKVILPLIIIKRLNDVLAPTKQQVLSQYEQYKTVLSDEQLYWVLTSVSGYGFYNISQFDFHKLLADPKHIAANLQNLIQWFSDTMKEIIAKFEFDVQLKKLKEWDLLYLIISEFNKPDLNFDLEHVSNMEMGYIFEELIRKFNEQSNETAWEHYTPREVIQLMVKLLLKPDIQTITDGSVKTIYDPCCGTWWMLTVAKDEILDHNNKAIVYLFGQELNPETYAICKADMLIKGEDADSIKGWEDEHNVASTLSNDQHHDKTFDYILSNPPYGVEWKKDKTKVDAEAAR
jgi:type I restriction enzyme M protein